MPKKSSKRKVKVRDISAPAATPQPEVSEPKKSRKGLYSCIVILVLALLVMAGILFWANQAAEKNLEEAKQDFTQQFFTEAKREYEFAAALAFFRPSLVAQAYSGIGDIFAYKMKTEEAAESYRKSLAKKENDDVRLLYAKELSKLHQYPEAEAQLREIQKEALESQLELAKVLLMQDKFDEAKNIYSELKPEGELYLGFFNLRDQKEEAMTQIGEITSEFTQFAKEAFARESFTAFDYVQLGNVLLENGYPSFALDFAREALKLEKNYRDAYALAARSHIQRGEYEEAQTSLTQAFAVSPLNASLWFTQAELYGLEGRNEEAKSAFAKAEELGENSLEFHYAYGMFAREQGDFATAVSQFEKVVLLDKDRANNFFSLYFWSIVDSGDLQKAKELSKHERADELFDTFIQFKLQEIDSSEVLEATRQVDGYSALDQYLSGLVEEDEDKAKEFFTRAIDYDTDGAIAPRAREELAILESE